MVQWSKFSSELRKSRTSCGAALVEYVALTACIGLVSLVSMREMSGPIQLALQGAAFELNATAENGGNSATTQRDNTYTGDDVVDSASDGNNGIHGSKN